MVLEISFANTNKSLQLSLAQKDLMSPQLRKTLVLFIRSICLDRSLIDATSGLREVNNPD